MSINRKKLAVWKFASCDGCQLSLLDLEDDILSLSEHIQIAHFLEASSHIEPGPYDLSLVEGSITTEHDAQRILDIREQSKYLVSIGACANAGGIQALKNYAKAEDFVALVYAHPEYISTLDHSIPIGKLVAVDYELQGCPINKHQLLELISSFLLGKKPNIPQESLCIECKRSGTLCVLVSQGVACLGPVTQAGCGALCPSYARGCFGCYGPKENANTASLARQLSQGSQSSVDLLRLFRNFNAAAPVFAAESRKHEK